MKLREWVLALLCGLLAAPVLAETWYEVEVIVLSHRKADSGGERWTANLPVVADLEKALPLPTAQSSADARMAPLPADQMHLNSEAQRVAADPGYSLLLHTGWRQAGLAREHSFPLRIYAVDGRAAAAGGEPSVRLDGTLRLILARYLHLEADLRYYPTDATANADGEAQEQPVFRLKEIRRMRSRELHYLDHPMFGIIALITPYEMPAPAATTPKKN